MENLLSVGQAAVIWSIVFAPCLAVVFAALKMDADSSEERGQAI